MKQRIVLPQTRLPDAPGIQLMLDISSSHLPKQLMLDTSNPEHYLADYPEGRFFYVGEDSEDVPFELGLVLDYARSCGCTVVRVDADADVINKLPTYEWES